MESLYNKVMSTYKTIILDRDGIDILQTPEEERVFEEQLELIKDVEGELVEVGVYMGATAKKISEKFPDRIVYAFDTFEGFLESGSDKDGFANYKVGDLKEANLETVQSNLKNFPKINLIKGDFPLSGKILNDKKIAFAHIDVDMYNPTKATLNFILPKMAKGGIIIVHDYPAHDGVRLAVNEFNLKNLIVVGGRQGVIKI